MDILELLIGFLILIAVACGTALNGKFLLPQLRRLHLGQRVRDDGPKTHLVKTGTPTFGGLMFLPPIAVVGLVLYLIGGFRSDIGILTLLILAMGAIGFVDDFVKVRINKEGLTVRQKNRPDAWPLCVGCIVHNFCTWRPGDIPVLSTISFGGLRSMAHNLCPICSCLFIFLH